MAMDGTVIFLHGPFMRSSRLTMDGLSASVAGRGWHVQRMSPPAGAGIDYLRRIIKFWNPVGIVEECALVGAMPLPDGEVDVPFVFVDLEPAQQKTLRRTEGRFGFVNSNSEALAELAARELLKRNFASYAFVTAYRRYHWSERRREAFSQAISLNGGEIREFDGVHLETGATARMNRFRKWLVSLPKPCGMLTANDRTAASVLMAAAQFGISIPEDISVIGIDNDDILCENMSPPLTSIQIDFFQGGFLAGQLLADLLAGNATGTELLYGARHIAQRLSTRRLGRRLPSVDLAMESIRRRATEGISAADILPLLGGSRRSAEKRFRSATGKSILEEIIDVRFEKLLPLLEQGHIALGALAGLTGFTSENQLQRQFKARFGMTLSAYRKSKRNAQICR